MPIKVAINGFGRIGRLTFRNLISNPNIEVVGINDLTNNATLAQLLKYDSSHGKFQGSVESTPNSLIVNGRPIQVTEIKDPALLPWKDLNVDVVIECTGRFVTRPEASKHITAGAKKVIISAPAKGSDVQTIVIGVNDDEITAAEDLFSNASCTTNCLAPIARIICDTIGLVQSSMTTIHAYTQDQVLQDAPHSDLRRARAAAVNIIPTSTGAAVAASLVVPEIAGKMLAIAIRVPVITGSLIDLNFVASRDTTAEEVNAIFKKASETNMKGIIEYSTDPLVSTDIINNEHSAIFDSLLTEVEGRFVKVVAWYDNESGYSARLAQLVGMLKF
ncbi:MAG: type I glyceraldehyde-3-phosphate dehydrogenase [Saprospiraceae bacterium]